MAWGLGTPAFGYHSSEIQDQKELRCAFSCTLHFVGLWKTSKEYYSTNVNLSNQGNQWQTIRMILFRLLHLIDSIISLSQEKLGTSFEETVNIYSSIKQCVFPQTFLLTKANSLATECQGVQQPHKGPVQ